MESKTMLVYDSIFEWAKNELKVVESKKQDVIREAAIRLEESGMPKNEISAALARELEGYATARYIRECLSDEFKAIEKRHLDIKHDEESVPQKAIPAENILEGVDWQRFKEAEKFFKPTEAESISQSDSDDIDYKQEYDSLHIKLAPFESKTEIEFDGMKIPLIVEVQPYKRQVIVYVDKRRLV